MSEEDKALVARIINRTGSSSCMEALLTLGRAAEALLKATADKDVDECWDVLRQIMI